MQRIAPFLWFDNQAEKAAAFYVSLFKNSKVGNVVRYGAAAAKASGRPEGSVMTVSFMLNGQEFVALNGGPVFKPTPAISFFASCKTEKEVNELFRKLSDNGKVLMPLDKYPFSERYGWVNDKYGVSWQVILADKEGIAPCLLFVNEQHGKAEEAMNFYVSLFKNSKIEMVAHYEKGEDKPGIKHGRFILDWQEFIAMDSGLEHKFSFTEATSFVVNCETQEEVNYFWTGLTEEGQEVQCGWLKDKYGVSWQVVPTVLNKMLQDKDANRRDKVMQAILKMIKIDIKTLEEAYGK